MNSDTKFLLIGGCSFSERIPDDMHEVAWKSWTNFFQDDSLNFFPNIIPINRAVKSSGNSKIVDSILENTIGNPLDTPDKNHNIEYVIVQWSAVGRGYSNNESDFAKRIIEWENYNLFNYEEELVSRELEYGQVTDRLNHVSYRYYQYSLHKILLLKNYLENNNIPYLFFWGWQQLTDELIKEYNLSKLVDLIYDGNWWRYDTHGGLSEYVIDKLGNSSDVIKPNDFHPTTKAHKYFYENIMKDEIIKLTKLQYKKVDNNIDSSIELANKNATLVVQKRGVTTI